MPVPSTVSGWSTTPYVAPPTAVSRVACQVTRLPAGNRSGVAVMVSVPVCGWSAVKSWNSAACTATPLGASAWLALRRAPATERPVYAPDRSAVSTRRWRTCAGVRFGAAAADTCGAAIEVPCMAA